MTRETRIGLLIGLLFIFAFGMILSELTGAGKSKQPAPGAATSDVAPAALPQNLRPIPHTVVPGAATDARENLAPSRNPGGGIVRTSYRTEDTPDGTLTVRVRPGQGRPVGRRDDAGRASQKNSVCTGWTYTVKAGDSLTSIARKYYGPDNGKEWRRIYNANRNVLSDESLLPVNTKLVIPPLPDQKAPAARTTRRTGSRGVRELTLAQLREEFRSHGR